MFAIAVIGLFAAYAVVSLLVIGMVASFANKRGRRGWVWGIAAAFVMYNLVFWDWLPTIVAHKYYCEKEAGFWVYKTLDQWKAENPGVMESLTTQRVWPRKHVGDIKNSVSTSTVNQRFNYVNRKSGPFLFNVWQHDQEIQDSKTGAVLAKQVDFSTGDGNVGGELELKFWIHADNCPRGRDKAIDFVKFFNQFKGAEK